ncbi:RcnB family protein [Rhizobium sp. AN80A]|uniref:RcnB family protein n=1 Tax=Rhizobium sp. AN80A TaxID=3040673 RepID=UPI0024B3B48F|nr:RcnB family protein [Rhizobium sp. AN80A]
MKKMFAVLLSASFLAAPLMAATQASAQDHRRPAATQDHRRPAVGQDYRRPVIVEREVRVTKYKWNRGQRMSAAERRRMQDVRDYRRYRLSAPPRGYRWVRVDNDYLMISIAGNVISNIISGR